MSQVKSTSVPPQASSHGMTARVTVAPGAGLVQLSTTGSPARLASSSLAPPPAPRRRSGRSVRRAMRLRTSFSRRRPKTRILVGPAGVGSAAFGGGVIGCAPTSAGRPPIQKDRARRCGGRPRAGRRGLWADGCRRPDPAVAPAAVHRPPNSAPRSHRPSPCPADDAGGGRARRAHRPIPDSGSGADCGIIFRSQAARRERA